MKIRSLVISGIIFSLIISIVYAGFLDYFGKITVSSTFSANSNIVLWLPLDENSGQTTGDISQYHNDGTLGSTPDVDVNDPVWTSDCKFGNCLSFDGSDDYVEVPSSTSLDVTDAITMEAWVKLNSGGTDTWYDIVRRGTGYEVSVSRDTGIIEIALNDGSWHWYDSTSTINRDGSTWYHIAVTWEKATGKVRIYINGILDPELDGITTPLQPTGNFWVGGATTAWSAYGIIDNPRIWNIALTQSQIQGIYSSGIP
jgi:hypothetical protein